MMILSDTTLMELIVNNNVPLINPFNIEDLQPCSVDLHLGEELKTIEGKMIDLTQESYKLKPNEFILGCTFETIQVPLNLVAQINGKSSIGRLGIMVHCTAGFIDSGFNGQVTLEIKNLSDKEFELKYNDCLCQIIFETLTAPVTTPYDGHYQGSQGVVNSYYEK